eukprot:EG_transcript_40490
MLCLPGLAALQPAEEEALLAAWGEACSDVRQLWAFVRGRHCAAASAAPGVTLYACAPAEECCAVVAADLGRGAPRFTVFHRVDVPTEAATSEVQRLLEAVAEAADATGDHVHFSAVPLLAVEVARQVLAEVAKPLYEVPCFQLGFPGELG